MDPLETDCRTVHADLQAGKDFLLLDCREENEHALVNIPQAKLLPMGSLVERIAELAPYKDKPIVVHCHHGGRSYRVAAYLKKNGFADVKSLAGGIERWAVEIDPSLPRY